MKVRNNRQLKTNLKVRMFFVFLILTMVIWMLIKLSKSYTTEIIFDIEYVNLPRDKVFQTDVVTQVKASVSSTGFNLLGFKFKGKELQFDLGNLANKKGSRYYFLPNDHLINLRLQLSDGSVIEQFSKDTIFITLGSNLTKKIPVELNADIHFKLGYNFVDTIKIIPDSVEITGPEAVLDTIDVISTDRIELLDVSTAIGKTVKLTNFDIAGLSLSTPSIIFTAEVDKFTEGSLTIPFKIINLPPNYRITTFPKEVQIVYKIGLKNFNKITAQNLLVVCDFNESFEKGVNYMTPRLQEQSPLISSVRFVPDKIEYLIEK